MQWVWWNGELIAEQNARLSVLDGAVLHGAALFETFRCYRGFPFRLEPHLKRLRRWLHSLQLFERARQQADLSVPTIAAAVARLIEANQLQETDARVRLTVTAGSSASAPACFLIATPLTAEELSRWREGISAVLRPDPRAGGGERPKWSSYAAHLEAQYEANALGAEEVIWFNAQERITEGATSNVFAWNGRELVTPPLQEGILAGITREAVMQICAQRGIPCIEAPLPVHDLLLAEAVFLTSSVREVVPLRRLQHRPFAAHPLTVQLQTAYRQLVETERTQYASPRS
jgi:branched-chain amino acid aminotransferase